jgi:hypothetical protein
MPTIGQLLTDIDIRVPNVFTTDQKIEWINEIQREIFKYMALIDTTFVTTVIDTFRYLLPSDIRVDLIKSVEVSSDLIITADTSFTPYTFKGFNEEFDGTNYFDALENYIGLYPVPVATGYKIQILYEKRPIALSSSNLSQVPELTEDYHNLLKYYCCSVIAKSGHNPDVQLTNNYMSDYNMLFLKMQKDLMERKIINPIKSRANGWWK